ncbi:MAG: flagellar M-ring protein FliF [Rhodopirellula sp. TMED11]|nr:MAG: flagellar M-ring protein FliF [Rhodopirellula sp. TMED11]
MALLSVLCILGIGGVGYWSLQPDYVILVSQAEADKIDRVIDSLDSQGIDYQLSGAGGNLLVTQKDYAQASIAARRAGVSGKPQVQEMPMGGLFGTPRERREHARRIDEINLAQTIENIEVVDKAVVHLSVPERGAFERETEEPSASVMLTLVYGQKLNQHQADSIASLVAYAVEGLTESHVKITDRNGYTYQTGDEGLNAVSDQMTYISALEERLSNKALDQLTRFVGYGNASVEVNLDVSFDQQTVTSTTYDPKQSVRKSENITEIKKTNADQLPLGAAGVASNITPNDPENDPFTLSHEEETIDTEYLNGEVKETNTSVTPVREQMTVSVVVNSDADWIASTGGVSPELETKIGNIVKNAIGFRDMTDGITVDFQPFAAPAFAIDTATVVPFDWSRITSIIEKASLAIAATLAFFLGLMLLRKYAPRTSPSSGDDQLLLERNRRESVEELSRLINQNPEVFTQLVRSWSHSDEYATVDSNPPSKAA